MSKYLEMKQNGASDLEITDQMKSDGLLDPYLRADVWALIREKKAPSEPNKTPTSKPKEKVRRKVVELAYNTSSQPISMRRSGSIQVTLVADITKTHYKALMSIVKLYNWKTKTGHVSGNDKDKLMELIDKMELSNAKVAEKSHKKCLEKPASKKVSRYEDPDLPTQRADGSWYDAETGFDIPNYRERKIIDREGDEE